MADSSLLAQIALVVVGGGITGAIGLGSRRSDRARSHDEWLRDLRRDAYATALDVHHEFWKAILSFIPDPTEEKRSTAYEAMREVGRASAGVDIAGPASVADALSLLVELDQNLYLAAFDPTRRAQLLTLQKLAHSSEGDAVIAAEVTVITEIRRVLRSD